MISCGWRAALRIRAAPQKALRRFHAQDATRFVDALCERQVLFVSGNNARGRASVAAAAALARACQRGPSLLVDADDPVHGMADVLGEQLGSSWYLGANGGNPKPSRVTCGNSERAEA